MILKYQVIIDTAKPFEPKMKLAGFADSMENLIKMMDETERKFWRTELDQ
jgi:hypothetical protein